MAFAYSVDISEDAYPGLLRHLDRYQRQLKATPRNCQHSTHAQAHHTPMPRIVIFGNTSGGKSTLARRLARTRGLPHVEIDRLYWQADWSVVPADVYAQRHAEAIAGEDWIIDGGGNLQSVRARSERATEIVLIDMPLWVHFWLAAERQIAWANGTLVHPPAGIADVPPTRRLFEIIWEVDRDWMPVLRGLCDEHAAKGKTVVRLTSLEAVDAFGG